MSRNMRLHSFLINLGSSMLPRESTNGSVADMLQRVRESEGKLEKIVLKVTDGAEICAECGFLFNIEGKSRFYPMHVTPENRISHFSNIAIGARVLGVNVDPVVLSNLSNGQYHISSDGIKKTK